MDNAMFVITVISTIATVISAVIAVRAKNEVKNLLNITGDLSIKNSGNNDGIISGINTGKISK